MIQRPLTEAETQYWDTWGELLDHGAKCTTCRTQLCTKGARLEQAHKDAKTQLSAERAAR
ncbi:hypothetical protein ACH40E_33570 [Streptomyces acidicola]|uniref:hypothetical protein n=1 Tax=Streptomyces acidicola TaxID=2596892 RepID=UPI0037BD5A21